MTVDCWRALLGASNMARLIPMTPPKMLVAKIIMGAVAASVPRNVTPAAVDISGVTMDTIPAIKAPLNALDSAPLMKLPKSEERLSMLKL